MKNTAYTLEGDVDLSFERVSFVPPALGKVIFVLGRSISGLLYPDVPKIRVTISS